MVAGSAVFKGEDPAAAVRAMQIWKPVRIFSKRERSVSRPVIFSYYVATWREFRKMVCINPPGFIKSFLNLFRRNKKKPAENDGQSA